MKQVDAMTTELLNRDDAMQNDAKTDTVNDQSENATRTHGIDISALKRGTAISRIEDEEIALQVKDLRLSYGEKEALHGINMVIPKKRVTAFIGPSGCGKSTLLRCFNRMNDFSRRL